MDRTFRRLTRSNLDRFVAWVDERGGPNSAEVAAALPSVTYIPEIRIDESSDPFSTAYWSNQISLYEEVSGRGVNQNLNELTQFHLEDHVGTPNSYATSDPQRLAIHFLRLSRIARATRLPHAADVLDMGSGWGLTSEFFATLGCRVLAVDINPQFVELVSRRAARLSLPIRTSISSFDDFDTGEKFDFIFFYESLHHALRAAELLQRCSSMLKPGGAIGCAAEPIQQLWWRHWGLRLDGLSIYCIRKFGWFETGWSRDFIISAFERCDLTVEFVEDADPEVGPILIARKAVGPSFIAAGDRGGLKDDAMQSRANPTSVVRRAIGKAMRIIRRIKNRITT
jgi:SAM-dependent methyltransferase